jgi:hypothetical protein
VKVLVACEFSGIVREAFARRGHDAWSCDLLPTEIPGNHIQGDVLGILNDGWDLMIAHPPCTYLTVTGNKWFEFEYIERFPERVNQRVDAIRFFMKFAMAPIDKICIENPVGIMSTLWCKPTQMIQPFQFGHTEAKLTCLWLKNLPALRYGGGIQMALGESQTPKMTEIKVPEYTTFKSGKRMATWYVDAAKDTDSRANIRSKTFTGIAKAMAEQWGTLELSGGKE